jgi:hypothetical protein
MSSLLNLKGLLRRIPEVSGHVMVARLAIARQRFSLLTIKSLFRACPGISADTLGPLQWWPKRVPDRSRTRLKRVSSSTFPVLNRKSLVKRVPDTCADTSGHLPPQRVRWGGSINRPPADVGRR